MIRLLYFSTAHSSVNKNVVDSIVETASAMNARHDITGALAFNGRNFAQVLEGKEADVRQLVRNIRNDERHSGFKVIDEKQITERHFTGWSMLKVDELDFSVLINAMQA